MDKTIQTFFIDKELLHETKKFLFKCVALKEHLELSKVTTRNGTQTVNIVNFIDEELLSEIYKVASNYIDQYYYNNLLFCDFNIDHMHLIKYDTDGSQKPHNHQTSDDHSFILYLNNSDGGTAFYNDVTPTVITPEEGKIVFFSSSINHEALRCTNEKQVAVGRLRFVHKVWSK